LLREDYPFEWKGISKAGSYDAVSKVAVSPARIQTETFTARRDLYGGTKFPKVDADAVSPYDVLG
jgi:hypothetical protein